MRESALCTLRVEGDRSYIFKNISEEIVLHDISLVQERIFKKANATYFYFLFYT